MIFPSTSNFGWEERSIWQKPSLTSPPRPLAKKKRELEKQLMALLKAPTQCDLARDLQAKIGRARDQLLIFCDYPGEVDVTNNTSERMLRPCVIQRKVTNGYRAMWAAEAEADVRTTVDTARLNNANPFAVIIGALA
jgi:transposase